MARKKKWSPTSHAPPSANSGADFNRPLDGWETDLLAYLQFGRAVGLPPGPALIDAYVASQKLAGLALSAIANRVEALRRIRPENVQATWEAHRTTTLVAELRKDHGNAGGPKRKTLLSALELESWLTPSMASTSAARERDLKYQVLWWALCSSGARPEETHTLKYQYSTPSPSTLCVQWNGRKNEKVSSARFWPFDHFATPPPHIAAWFAGGRPLPIIGTRKNVAQCVNSWIDTFHRRSKLPRPCSASGTPFHVTSTCPRLRMDNILRDELDAGRISLDTYEVMIGHTIKVSNTSYRR